MPLAKKPLAPQHMSCSGSSHTGLADLIHKQFRENVVFTPLKTNVVGVLWGQNVGGESLGTLQQQRVSKPLQKHSQTGTKFEISEIGVLSHHISAEYLHIWSDVSRTACFLKSNYPDTPMVPPGMSPITKDPGNERIRTGQKN